MREDTCPICGVPLAFDALVYQRDREPTVGDEVLCSYCAAPRRNRKQITRLAGREWMLEKVLDIYRSGGRLRRAFAGLLARLSPVLPRRAASFARLIDSIPHRTNRSTYDALVLYSGGKDSSYMLMNLARRDLKLCAWMLDQGYQSPAALQNARALCERLAVPLVIERADKPSMDELFRLGLEIGPDDHPDLAKGAMTYGSACWPCFAVLLANASVFCTEHDVPLCFIGTRKGQNQLALLAQPELAGWGLPNLSARARSFATPLRSLALRKGLRGAGLLETTAGRAVTVPFYEFVQMPDAETLKRALGQAGWSMPSDTGSCSSNCLLNELGRRIMRSHFGFDLYQVSSALERRLAGRRVPPDERPSPSLDEDAVVRGAAMIGLSQDGAGEDAH